MRGLMCLAGLLLCLTFGSSNAQTVYRLQPGDTLQLWIAQEPDLSREVVVAPDGWLSFPLAGHLQAAGLSLTELEGQILERLKVYFTDNPNLTIMLRPNAQHQPLIYVTGEVMRPGEYPHRANMTVLHGVSVAGGIYRNTLLAADQDRSVLVRRQVEQAQLRLEELKARIIRLQAESRGERSIGTPEALAASPALAQEQSLLNARMETLDMAARAQNQANDMAERTASALREQSDSLSTRVELARRRLQSITNLIARGGAESSQQTVQEGAVAELEGQVSRVKSEIMVAERTRGTDAARYESTRQDYRTQLLVDLNAARHEQGEVEARLGDNMRIMQIYTQNEAANQQRQTRSIAYHIVRSVDGVTRELTATETTPLLPGDLVRVLYGDSSGAGNVPSEATSERRTDERDTSPVQVTSTASR